MLGVCGVQDFIETYFPTRDIFAPLANFILRIKPKYDKKIKEFKHKNFKLFNIGMQVCMSHTLPQLDLCCCQCPLLYSLRHVLPGHTCAASLIPYFACGKVKHCFIACQPCMLIATDL